MAEFTRNNLNDDLNVVLKELVAAPAAVSDVAADMSDSVEAGKFRRALAELEMECGRIDEPMKSELASTISSLRSQFNTTGMTPNIASALQEARTQANAAAIITAQNNQAALSDAILDFGSYRLSAAGEARVAERMAALSNRDFAAYLDTFNHDLDGVPPAEKARIVDIREALGESPQGQAKFGEMADIQAADPVGWKAVETYNEANATEIDNLIVREEKRIPPRKDMQGALNFLRATGMYAHPEARALLDAITQGKPADVIEAELSSLSGAYQDAAIPEIRYLRESKPEVLNSFIEAQPLNERAKLRYDDAALAKRLAETAGKATSENITMALGTDPSKRTPQQNAIVEGNVLTSGMEIAVLSKLSIRHYAQMKELAMSNDISDEIRANIGLVENVDGKEINTLVRAQAMITGTMKHATNSELNNKLEKAQNKATALSVLTLGYTDTHGGLAIYSQHAQVLAMLEKRDGPRPSENSLAAAKAYFADYDLYLGKTLLGENIDVKDPETSVRLTEALERAGSDLRSGALLVTSQPDGSLLFRDRNSYTERTAVYDNAGFSVRSPKEIADAWYTLARAKAGNEASKDPRIQAALLIDTYRLYNTPEGKDLIQNIANGQFEGKGEMILALVESQIAPIVGRMNEFSSAIKAQMDKDLAAYPDRVAALKEMGAIDVNGKLDVEIIMNNAMWAKFTFIDYKTYAEWTPEELLKGKIDKDGSLIPAPEKGAERYQARLAYTVAAQYYTAQALENVTSLSKDFERDMEKLVEAGKVETPEMAMDREMYRVLAADPHTTTRDQRLAAITRFVERDSYISAKGREALKATTIGVMVAHLESEEHRQEHLQDKEMTTPAMDKPADTDLTPISAVTAADLEEANKQIVLNTSLVGIVPAPLPTETINENEGSGLFDKLDKDAYETKIFEAVKGLSAESRRVMFGSSVTLNEVNKGATGVEAIYSYNEIETALKRLGHNNAEKIVDVNGNGFDAEDIRAALVPNLAASAPGQGKA